jgi:CRISPR/Cas system-associated endoribonuclease Cas2
MSRRLRDFGVRIQESVFECLLDEKLYDRMIGAQYCPAIA